MNKKRLVVVVDMVEGFVNFGNLADKNINRIVPNIENLIYKSLKAGDDVIAFKDTHDENDVEFKDYPVHCVRGTKECELVPELRKYEPYMKVIEKPTTNGFATKEFRTLIENNYYDEIAVCGCCTDICVSNFLGSLRAFFHVNRIPTKIFVAIDGVDTFNAPDHNADDVNEKYLRYFNNKLNCNLFLIAPENVNELGEGIKDYYNYER